MAKLFALPKTRAPEPDNVKSIAAHIGKRLRLLRFTKGLSQAELGKIIGVSFQQIQKYERGLNHISATNLYHISQTLSVSFDYFITGLGESPTTLEADVTPIDNLRIAGLLRSLNAIKNSARRDFVLSSLKVILDNIKE